MSQDAVAEALQKLYAEKKRIEDAIRALELLTQAKPQTVARAYSPPPPPQPRVRSGKMRTLPPSQRRRR